MPTAFRPLGQTVLHVLRVREIAGRRTRSAGLVNAEERPRSPRITWHTVGTGLGRRGEATTIMKMLGHAGTEMVLFMPISAMSLRATTIRGYSVPEPALPVTWLTH